jgi:hypothetical protein
LAVGVHYHGAEVAMAFRCANPQCRFDYYSMRAVCLDPACLQQSQAGCGCYYRFREDGTAEKLTAHKAPPEAEDIAWLCCCCAAEYDLVSRGQLRIAPDPLAFVFRWQIERAEACIAHEAG